MVARNRKEALLAELRTDTLLTSDELALRLGVSSRSIRNYVRNINAALERPIIASDHNGYRLISQKPTAEKAVGTQAEQSDPEQRLYYIGRRLVTEHDEVDIFELAAELQVADSTIEADLGRIRELLQSHQLTLSRSDGYVRIVGPERQQRRLVRHLLLNNKSIIPVLALGAGTPGIDRRIRALRAQTRLAISNAGLVVNEYVLQDLLLHLAIAVERITVGHTLPSLSGNSQTSPTHDSADPAWQVTLAVAQAITQIFDVILPEVEKQVFYDILAARSRSKPDDRSQISLNAEAVAITRDSLRAISQKFMLDLYDESTLTGIALHIQNLMSRARMGRMYHEPPLGQSFRRKHPLIHELALCFATEIETRTGARIAAGEVDFLSFHLGNQIVRQMEHGSPVSVTLVLPQYDSFSTTLEADIVASLPAQATVLEVITSLDYDWKSINSDLVISVVDLVPSPPAPVVRISPFLTAQDRSQISEAVNTERQRAELDNLRMNLISLLDRRLFFRVPAISRDDCLALLAGILNEQGFVGDDFFAAVRDREERASTAFGPTFALPHSISMNAHKTGIAVLISQTPIAWESPTRLQPWANGSASATLPESPAVRLVLMFAISPDGRVIFRDVLDSLIRLLGTANTVRKLIEAGTDYDGFVEMLMQLVTVE